MAGTAVTDRLWQGRQKSFWRYLLDENYNSHSKLSCWHFTIFSGQCAHLRVQL